MGSEKASLRPRSLGGGRRTSHGVGEGPTARQQQAERQVRQCQEELLRLLGGEFGGMVGLRRGRGDEGDGRGRGRHAETLRLTGEIIPPDLEGGYEAELSLNSHACGFIYSRHCLCFLGPLTV